jgi:hypothetical protein
MKSRARESLRLAPIFGRLCDAVKLQCPPLVSGFFMRCRMGGMRLLLQSVLLLAQDSEGADSRFESSPSPFAHHDVSAWWLIAAAIVIMALCCIILSVMNKGHKGSLWKDEDSEMNSAPIAHD